VNVDRRRLGTSVLGMRILVAGLVLLAAGYAVLGWGTRFGKSVRNQGSALRSSFVGPNSAAPSQAEAQSILQGLPLVFEPNQGQANLQANDPRAQFVSHGPGYKLVLGNEGALLSLVSRTRVAGSTRAETRFQTFQMKVAGEALSTHLTGTDPLPGRSNYFLGNEPAKWRTGIPQFARVRYANVYPGINFVFYGNQGHLEYDLQVAPGADPSQAQFEFGGAKKLELKDGSLVIHGDSASVQLEAPTMYQEINGRKQSVEGAFVLRAENRVGFAVGAYDHSRELIIDPILNFSTFFGGSGDEHHTSVTVDGSLNIYLSGSTTSPDLPVTTGVFQGTLSGAENVYIAKIQPPLGSIPARLAALTYLGGTGSDYPVGIAVDGEGDPFVAGTTTSGNFPTTPIAYQPNPASAGTHAFVTKLKFDFSGLDYSSYLSGNGSDIATGMSIDSQGLLYVTGTTTSIETSPQNQFPATNLPNPVPYQTTSRATAGTPQFFVTKVNPLAQGIASILYSTYFGGGTFNGTAVATGGGIAVDTHQNVYFTGTTNFTYTGVSSVTDFPILNAYQPCLNSPPPTTIVPPQTCGASSSGAPDAFVAKLNTAPNTGQGQQLVWSTYVGGTGNDSGTGVAIDSGAANVYVVGTTNSPDFVNASLVKSFAPYEACLNNVTLTPASGTVTCAAQPNNPPSNDAFVARVSNPSLTTTATQTTVALGYFSYLGGSSDEAGTAIAVDTNAGALITGSTNSPLVPPTTAGNPPQAGSFPVFPYPSSVQSSLNGAQNAFVARLNSGATVGQTTIASWATYFGGNNTDTGTGIALDVNQSTYIAGDSNSSAPQFPVIKALQAQNNGGFDSFVAQLGPAVSLSISGVLNLGTGQQYISAGNPATFTYTVTNSGPDLATNIVILADFTQTQVPVSSVSATISSGTCGAGGTATSISCGPVSLQAGSTATMTVTLTPGSVNSSQSTAFNGGTVQAIAPSNIVLAQTSVPAQMSDFTMTVSPRNFSIPVAGATATYTVGLTPGPVYASNITVSCSGLPAAATCPSQTVNLINQSGASVNMQVTTTARPVTTAASSLFTRRFYALWLMIPGMALVGVGNRRRRRILGFLMLCTLFTLVLLIPACSSSKTTTPVSGTPAGNYTITITAAAGSDSKSQTVVLTVP
jgi:Domain of unknown function DUF11/Beta-propeller repeat